MHLQVEAGLRPRELRGFRDNQGILFSIRENRQAAVSLQVEGIALQRKQTKLDFIICLFCSSNAKKSSILESAN